MRVLSCGVPEDVSRALSVRGCHLMPVIDGDDALSALAHCFSSEPAPDVLLVKLDEALGITPTYPLRVQNSGHGVPVIVLGTPFPRHTEPDIRIKVLDSGGADFLSLPVYLDELVACMRARKRLARAVMPPPLKPVTVGPIMIDVQARRVTCGGKLINFSPSEYRLLDALARAWAQGRFATIQQLKDALDPNGRRVSKLISVYVCKVRKKLEKAKFGASWHIVTHWGEGLSLSDQPVVPYMAHKKAA